MLWAHTLNVRYATQLPLATAISLTPLGELPKSLICCFTFWQHENYKVTCDSDNSPTFTGLCKYNKAKILTGNSDNSPTFRGLCKYKAKIQT